MTRYLMTRLFYFFLALLVLSVVTFSLNWLFPGDPLTNMSGIRDGQAAYNATLESRAFDSTVIQQYVNYLAHITQFDWGLSLSTGNDVWQDAATYLVVSAELVLLSFALAVLIGLPLGMLAANYFRHNLDKFILTSALTGYSIPVFWLAQLLILLFAVQIEWLPITGQINPLYAIDSITGSVIIDILLSDSQYKLAALQDALLHLVLPVLTLSSLPSMLLLRITRNQTIEVLQKPYVKAARARGLSQKRLLFKHALPNVLQDVLPQMTFIFGLMMANLVIVEHIFNWPGAGAWLLKAIIERDYPIIQMVLFTLMGLILVLNLLVEIYRGWRFPMTREERYGGY